MIRLRMMMRREALMPVVGWVGLGGTTGTGCVMVYLNHFFFGMILKPNQTDKKKPDLIVWGSFHE